MHYDSAIIEHVGVIFADFLISNFEFHVIIMNCHVTDVIFVSTLFFSAQIARTLL